MNKIKEALQNLQLALEEKNIKLNRILVDKTLPLKYELVTGLNYDDTPRVACDPFTQLNVEGVVIVGQDNELYREHPEWPTKTPVQTRWVNVYDDFECLHKTELDAINTANYDELVATVPVLIEYEEEDEPTHTRALARYEEKMHAQQK
jgi:hypothetical protein